MKKVLFLLLLVTIFVAACTQPPGNVAQAQFTEPEAMQEPVIDGQVVKAIDVTASSFEFEGYKVGGSHIGVFDVWKGTITYEDGVIVAAEGSIQVDSVKTDNPAVDRHLLNDDFFSAEEFPQIITKSKSISDGMLTMDLTFKGITKEIIVPVTVTENSVSTEFLLDVSPYDFNHAAVQDEVRIKFNFVSE